MSIETSTKPTPGPWRHRAAPYFDYIEHENDGLVEVIFTGEIGTANARLIAEAPAMELALELVACGLAKIERDEFCLCGIRYRINGSWNALFDAIGWGWARNKIAKVKGGAP